MAEHKSGWMKHDNDCRAARFVIKSNGIFKPRERIVFSFVLAVVVFGSPTKLVHGIDGGSGASIPSETATITQLFFVPGNPLIFNWFAYTFVNSFKSTTWYRLPAGLPLHQQYVEVTSYIFYITCTIERLFPNWEFCRNSVTVAVSTNLLFCIGKKGTKAIAFLTGMLIFKWVKRVRFVVHDFLVIFNN